MMDVADYTDTRTMSSCSVRCTPSFFRPIDRSLTHIPPSPLTSRIWNSTFNLWSCSGPPQSSHGCGSNEWNCSVSSADTKDWPGGRWFVGEVQSCSSACLSPPPGLAPRWDSEESHWQKTPFNSGEIKEPFWCIIGIKYFPFLSHTTGDRIQYIEWFKKSLHALIWMSR
jgi:hypothetical protein